MTKTKQQIRDEAAEKLYKDRGSIAKQDQLTEAFIAGFDCCDKLGNEALKIALDGLEKLSKPYDVSYETNYAAICEYDKITATKALAEIKKIVGEG